jgi:hypothetical protein
MAFAKVEHGHPAERDGLSSVKVSRQPFGRVGRKDSP